MRIGVLLLSICLVAACDDGDTTLIRIFDEPAGEHCAEGGAAIASGLDANANGTLDDDEILSTSYVCDGESPEDATTTLVETADAGDACPDGGTTIRIGPDTDGDGVLDDGEITQTIDVCDGAGGVSILVATEDAGSACADGGTAVHTGADDNDDGVLQAGERDSTTYVCNGDDGVSVLIETEDAATGDCEHGGTTVHTGVDDDGDGDLETAEYDATTHVCNGADSADTGAGPIITGSYEINNSLDLALLEGVTEITGDLVIDVNGMTSIALPELVVVGGTIYVVSVDLLQLSLPALAEAGAFILDASSLEELDVSALTVVSNSVAISAGELPAFPFTALTSADTVRITGGLSGLVTLPALTEVGTLSVQYAADVTGLSAPVLESVTSSLHSTNNSIDTLDFPALATAGAISIQSCDAMTTLALPVLTTASGSISLSFNEQLESLSFPVLTTAGPVTLSFNPVLGSVSLPLLEVVSGNLFIQSAASLTALDLPELTSVAGTLSISNNAALASLSLPGLTSAGAVSLSDSGLGSISLPLLDTVSGNLSVQFAATLAALDLPALTSVDGTLTIASNSALASLSLPELTSADAVAVATSPVLGSITLPLLTSVSGNLSVQNAAPLAALDLPELTSLDGTLTIANNYALASLTLPALTSAGGVAINSPVLATITLPFLGIVGGTLSVQSTALAALDLPVLTSVTGTVTISNNSALTSLSLPAVTTIGALSMSNDDALTVLDLPALTAITGAGTSLALSGHATLGWVTMPLLASMGGNMSVSSSPQLPACHVTDIRTRLQNAGWTGTASISGTVTCIAVSWCRLQSPLDATAAPGDPLTYYGRYYASGFTTVSATNQSSSLVAAAIGVGPDGSDPATAGGWTWTTAAANAAWNGTGTEPNNDEWMASVTTPAAGLYDTAFRFSGDRGRTWLYCDRNAGSGADGAENGYQTANAGSLTVN